MSIKETTVKVLGVKEKPDEKRTTIYETTWDGFLDEWIEIGGEVVGFIDDYDRIEIIMTPKK